MLPGKVGKFDIRAELGHGGFGIVYLAYDPKLQREVAIKLIESPSDNSKRASGEPGRAFSKEARALSTLQHPNIVSVYEWGDEGGKPFLVMELIRGRSLRTMIEEERSADLHTKLSIIEQIAHGLLFAHDLPGLGPIIHRDINPKNIMVTADNKVAKLVDFGLALILGQSNLRDTEGGFFKGTYSYSAPEQIQQFEAREIGRADRLTDIFSFGVTCYEFISGSNPFLPPQPSRTAVFDLILACAPPPLPNVPSCLNSLIQRAMAKDREDRYQNVAEFLADLGRAREELTQLEAAVTVTMPSAVVAAHAANLDSTSLGGLHENDGGEIAPRRPVTPAGAAGDAGKNPARRTLALASVGLVAAGVAGYLAIGRSGRVSSARQHSPQVDADHGPSEAFPHFIQRGATSSRPADPRRAKSGEPAESSTARTTSRSQSPTASSARTLDDNVVPRSPCANIAGCTMRLGDFQLVRTYNGEAGRGFVRKSSEKVYRFPADWPVGPYLHFLSSVLDAGPLGEVPDFGAFVASSAEKGALDEGLQYDPGSGDTLRGILSGTDGKKYQIMLDLTAVTDDEKVVEVAPAGLNGSVTRGR